MIQGNAVLNDVAGCGGAQTRLRAPKGTDGSRVWDLIEATPALDGNSLYANLLQCTHFAATCAIAEQNGEVVGWMSGYIPPDQPDTLFVWQICVSAAARGQGLGKRLVGDVLMRPVNAAIRRVSCTITEANDASWALFGAIARSLDAPMQRAEHFTQHAHFAGEHASELAVTIGPFRRDRAATLAANPTTSTFVRHISRETRTMTLTKTTSPLATFERVESRVRSYSRSFPKMFDKAVGATIYDTNGRAYTDFLAGCSTLNYGHNDPDLKAALIDYVSADGIAHGLDMFTDAKEHFLSSFERHVLQPRNMNYRVQFTGPTGANAVEAALKLARKVTGRTNVISFTNGFHGVTLGALAATGNGKHRSGAATPLSGVTRAAYDGYYGPDINTADLLERQLSDPSSGIDAPAAIIVETVQGEGGLNAASKPWLQQIQAIARKHGALFIIDDIQAGCGRTGGFFSFDDMDLSPDLITMAKSLSGMGLPLAVTLIKPEHDIWKPAEHNGTFRGNNHAFITAAAAIEKFWSDEGFATEVADKAAYLADRLGAIAEEHDLSVKGRGMMLGINAGSGEHAAAICKSCFANGLIIETSGSFDEIVKVLAPLTISKQQLGAGLDVLETAFAAVMGMQRAAAE